MRLKMVDSKPVEQVTFTPPITIEPQMVKRVEFSIPCPIQKREQIYRVMIVAIGDETLIFNLKFYGEKIGLQEA